MNSNRREREKEVTMLSSPERVLHDSRRIAATSSAMTCFANTSTTPEILEAALEEVATPVSRAEAKTCSKASPIVPCRTNAPPRGPSRNTVHHRPS